MQVIEFLFILALSGKYIHIKKTSPQLSTSNEGPVRIQYKCLVPIYVFPEMKLCGLVISKTE
jgi:hypothetical protein